jgi:hypothetical protein
MFGLTEKELRALKKLSTPIRIQNYLNGLPFNFEKKGETHMSPKRVLREKKAHCIEGALLAAVALWLQGGEPLIVDFTSAKGDDDHIIALYKKNGYWGAISKTNHATLRFRDPVYKTLRELALSYFHEWFIPSGKKTLRSYSKPFNLKTLGMDWITAEEELWHLDAILDGLPHFPLVPAHNMRYLREADPMEKRAGMIVEWKKNNPRT